MMQQQQQPVLVQQQPQQQQLQQPLPAHQQPPMTFQQPTHSNQTASTPQAAILPTTTTAASIIRPATLSTQGLPTIAAPSPLTALSAITTSVGNTNNTFCEESIGWYEAEKASLIRPSKAVVHLDKFDIGYSPTRNVFVLSNLTKKIHFALKPDVALKWIKGLLYDVLNPQNGVTSLDAFQCRCQSADQPSDGEGKLFREWLVYQDADYQLR